MSKQNKIRVDTWCPLFPGFYGTVFDYNESDYHYDSEFENIQNLREDNGLLPLPDHASDRMDFDYDGYREEIAKNCVLFVEDILQSLNMVDSITYQSISSPKEYNYYNDSINIEVVLTRKNIKNINRFIDNNVGYFSKHLKDTYTSRSGFISGYSNDYNDWIDEDNQLLPGILEHEHKLGSILEFVIGWAELEDHPLISCEGFEWDLYEYATQDVYLSCSNIDEMVKLEILVCVECKKELDYEYDMLELDYFKKIDDKVLCRRCYHDSYAKCECCNHATNKENITTQSKYKLQVGECCKLSSLH